MNNMKFGKTTVFAAVFAPLAAFAAELTLFDSAKDSAVVESGAVVAKTPEGLVVSYSEKPEPLGGVAIDGNWDLSKYSALKFEIENLGKGDIPLIIVAQNAKPDWGKRHGLPADLPAALFGQDARNAACVAFPRRGLRHGKGFSQNARQPVLDVHKQCGRF